MGAVPFADKAIDDAVYHPIKCLHHGVLGSILLWIFPRPFNIFSEL
jgi:hypothetical protein